MVKKSNLRQKLFKIIIRIQRAIGINIISTSRLESQQDQVGPYRKSELDVNAKELKQEKDLALTGKRKSWTKAEIEAARNSINSQASPKFLKEAEDLFKKPVIVSLQRSPKRKRNPKKEEELMKECNKNTSPAFSKMVKEYFSKSVIVSNLPSTKSESNKDNQNK